jgi:hypothetical protein
MGNRFPASLLNQPAEIQPNRDLPQLKTYDAYTVVGYYEGSLQVSVVNGFQSFPYVMQALAMNAPRHTYTVTAPTPPIRSQITHKVAPGRINPQTAASATAPTRGIYTGVQTPY